MTSHLHGGVMGRRQPVPTPLGTMLGGCVIGDAVQALRLLARDYRWWDE